MIIVSNNLKRLIVQKGIVPSGSYDTFSISLTLGKSIRRYNLPSSECLDYSKEIPNKYIETIEIEDEYVLNPHQAILACSREYVKMPKGYMGILQTKGSLARLFVMAHCCDGQIEPGFEGCVTFEVCNVGSHPVKLHLGQGISQMFLFKVSSNKDSYNGKYSKSNLPTYYMIENEK